MYTLTHLSLLQTGFHSVQVVHAWAVPVNCSCMIPLGAIYRVPLQVAAVFLGKVCENPKHDSQVASSREAGMKSNAAHSITSPGPTAMHSLPTRNSIL